MSVCIVGNSDNVLDIGMGKLIDKCDYVIRINDFLISGHENDVGSKTTIIACAFSGANKIINDHGWPTRSMFQAVNVWMVRPPRPDRIQRALSAGINPEKIINPDPVLYNSLIMEVYSRFWRKEPSSGLVTIAMAISIFPNEKIFIHGFDNRTGQEGKRHYFDPRYFDIDKPNDPVGHDWAAENMYIEDLVISGKIERLK